MGITFTTTKKPTPYPQAVLKDNPTIYWRFEEPSGDIIDHSGNGFHITYVQQISRGEPPLVKNSTYSAFWHNGVDSAYYRSDENQPMDVVNKSIEFWYLSYPIDGPRREGRIINTRDSYTNRWVVATGDDNDIDSIIFVADGGTNFRTPALTRDVIHHIVGIFNGTTWTVYVDGESVSPQTPVETNWGYSHSSNTQIQLGARLTGFTNSIFRGSLDEMSLYDYELSEGQVIKHYNSGVL